LSVHVLDSGLSSTLPPRSPDRAAAVSAAKFS